MGYEIMIARISNDLQKTQEISEQDWINCQIVGEIEYKNTKHEVCLELPKLRYKDGVIPCIWITKDLSLIHI